MSQLSSMITSTQEILDRVAGSPEAEKAVVDTFYAMLSATEWDDDSIMFALTQVHGHAMMNRYTNAVFAAEACMDQEKQYAE